MPYLRYKRSYDNQHVFYRYEQFWWDLIQKAVKIRIRDRFVYAPSQWETTLQSNVVSHCMCANTKRSLLYTAWKRQEWDLRLIMNSQKHIILSGMNKCHAYIAGYLFNISLLLWALTSRIYWMQWKVRCQKQQLAPGSISNLWLSMIWADGRTYYICNVFSRWLITQRKVKFGTLYSAMNWPKCCEQGSPFPW